VELCAVVVDVRVIGIVLGSNLEVVRSVVAGA
jgi:hypothetical protein